MFESYQTQSADTEIGRTNVGDADHRLQRIVAAVQKLIDPATESATVEDWRRAQAGATCHSASDPER